jgi:mevalonate kinase
MGKVFPSKVLLFGEYTVLIGGAALALPEHSYFGKWELQKEPSKEFQQLFWKWWDYLHQNIPQIDADSLAKDWESGFRFVSNIPAGYGLGSSGVLTAIVLYYYGDPSIQTLEVEEVRRILAKMESFFHGTSSGLDPLVSYYNKPFFVKNGEFHPIDSPIDLKDWTYQLVDSGRSRVTAECVASFQHKINADLNFSRILREQYLPVVNRVIESILRNTTEDWESDLPFISQFQKEHFHWLVPPNIQKLWEENKENKYYKICGAGGGGFFLSFEKKKG